MNTEDSYVQIAHILQRLPDKSIAHFVGRVAVIVLGGRSSGSLTLVDVRDFFNGEWVPRIGDERCVHLNWQEVPLTAGGLSGEAPGTEHMKRYKGGHCAVFFHLLSQKWEPFDPMSFLVPSEPYPLSRFL